MDPRAQISAIHIYFNRASCDMSSGWIYWLAVSQCGFWPLTTKFLVQAHICLKICLKTSLRYEVDVFIVFTELLACQPPFSQTAYRTVGTTITCDYPGNTFKNNDIYVCKEKGSVCEESSRTFIKRQTNASLSVSISDVSLRDQGVYWCAIKRGKYRAAFKRVELQVKGEKHTDRPQHTSHKQQLKRLLEELTCRLFWALCWFSHQRLVDFYMWPISSCLHLHLTESARVDTIWLPTWKRK